MRQDPHQDILDTNDHPLADLLRGTLPIQRKIGQIGIKAALAALLPCIREAGLLARTLQPFMSEADTGLDKGGSQFASALTDADLLVEGKLGGDILLRFADASFYGEEYKQDRVSKYIKDGKPYLVTLDPINGTLYYKYGLPTYEVIVTICDDACRMLGALIYRPMYDDTFLGWKDPRDGSDAAYHVTFRERGLPTPLLPKVDRLVLKHTGERVVLLGRDYSDQAETVRAAGYTPIFPWRDFNGQKDWKYASESLLTGASVGRLGAGAQLIDAGAFGFLMERAGGIYEPGPFDSEQKTFAHGLMAADEETARLLRALLMRKLTVSG